MLIVSSKITDGVLVLLEDGTDITHLIDLESVSITVDKDTKDVIGISLNCGTDGLTIENLDPGDYADETETTLNTTLLN